MREWTSAFQLFCCLRWCHCCDPYPEDARPIECSTLLGRHVKLFKVYTRKANWSAWPCQHWLWIDIPWIDIPIHPPGTFFGLKPEAGLNVSGSRWISQRCGHSFLGDGLYWNQHMAHSCVSIRIMVICASNMLDPYTVFPYLLYIYILCIINIYIYLSLYHVV